MTGTVTRIPVPMKRGRKVTRGPQATLLQFPDTQRELWLTFMSLPRQSERREDWESCPPGMERSLTPDEYRRRIRYRIDELRETLDKLEARGF